MSGHFDKGRRVVGKSQSQLKRWGNNMPSKHFDWKAARAEMPPADPVRCMFYVEGAQGSICGDPDTEWDNERTTWLCNTHRKEMNRQTRRENTIARLNS